MELFVMLLFAFEDIFKQSNHIFYCKDHYGFFTIWWQWDIQKEKIPNKWPKKPQTLVNGK